MEQRTDEWFAARSGKVTASRIADVMAKLKTGKPSASRETYMGELVAERFSGTSGGGFTNAAMQWGTDTEPQARDFYCFQTGIEVSEIGFVDHPAIAMSGASPDGLAGDKGLVEIKCPNTATHIKTLDGAPIDRKYLLQMQWQMACCERDWCDFVSFDPRLPVELQMLVQRVERDDKLLAEIETEVRAFITELDSTMDRLIERYMKKETV